MEQYLEWRAASAGASRGSIEQYRAFWEVERPRREALARDLLLDTMLRVSELCSRPLHRPPSAPAVLVKPGPAVP